MRAQMFVVTMIFLVGLIFFVQQALFGYTALDLSGPYESEDYYVNENIRSNVDEIIKGSATCEEANEKIMDFVYFVQKETIKRGYELNLDYLVDCSGPFPPP